MKPYKTMFCLLAGALSSCDSFTSKPLLSGKREDLFLENSPLKGEKHAKVTFNENQITVNKEWRVAGGNLSNALPPLKISKNLVKKWRTYIGSGSSAEKRFVSNLLVNHSSVFAMGTNGQVVSIDKKTGEKRWSVETSPPDFASETLGGGIAYEEDKLFITTSFGDVISIDANTGKEIWRHTLVTPLRIAPTIAQGRLFVVTINNELYALDTKTGAVLWNHAGLPEFTGLLGGGVPSISKNVIVVPYSSGEIYALRVENGYPLWTDTLTPSLNAGSLSYINHIRARPIIDKDVLYVVSHGGCMAAIDVHSGIRLWQADLPSVRTPAIFGQYIYIVSMHNDLVCLNRENGEKVWVMPLPQTQRGEKINWAGPLITSQGLLVSGSNGSLDFYSPQTGLKQQSISTSQSFSLSPLIVEETLYILGDSGDITAWH